MNTDRGLSGSFDPITNGAPRHRRAGRWRCSTRSSSPSSPIRARRRSFTVDERIAIIREALASRGAGRSAITLEVEAFDGLTVDFAQAAAPVRSSAACARSATSRPRCSSPTTTASWRRDVDTVFFMTAVENGYVELEPGQGDRRASAGDVVGDGPGGGRRGAREGPARETLTRHRVRESACDPSLASLEEHSRSDIIFLARALELLIANGKKLPSTTNVVVDQNAALGLIDQLARRRPRGGPAPRSGSTPKASGSSRRPTTNLTDRRPRPGAGGLPHR